MREQIADQVGRHKVIGAVKALRDGWDEEIGISEAAVLVTGLHLFGET